MRTTWTSPADFTLDGIRYHSAVSGGHDDGHDQIIYKDQPLVALYEDLIERHQPRTIVELGIFKGGGAALIAQLAKPERLVALDYTPEPCPLLERFIDDRALRDTVRPYYGVDQADTAALDRIMATEFDGPIDLVIDDASHLVDQTRASFNRLFPHVRPGGLYVIEDWSWAHLAGGAVEGMYADTAPLSAFVIELVLASCRIPRTIVEVTVDKHWAVVRRGDAPLRPERFDVADHFDPLGQQTVDHANSLRTAAG